ncbi:MAG: helix-turn-helix domain-containing protein [Candidatus Aminicenantes bacterium]|nr:MAG: helix-turn-helix domain-containing protein [Candidatus Aminicenantes bacterium]
MKGSADPNQDKKRLFKLAIIAFIIIVFLPASHFAHFLNSPKSISQFAHLQWTTQNGLPHNTIQSIYQTRDGYLWIGTEAGLVRFNGKSFSTFDQTSLIHLPVSEIMAIYEDHDRNLWLGTFGEGLYIYKKGLFTQISKDKGFHSQSIFDIREDDQGNIWMGTGDGLVRYKNDRFDYLTTENGLSNNTIIELYKDRNDNIWFGSLDGSVFKIEKETADYDDIHDVMFQKAPIEAFYVEDIFEDKDGNILVPTGSGLFFFKEGNTQRYGKISGISDFRILSMIQSQSGHFWAGTSGNGLIRLNQNHSYDEFSDRFLNNEVITVVFEDKNENIWIGTRGSGLHKLYDGCFSTFTVKEGLINNYIRSIFEDSKGRLWIGTNRGLNYMLHGRVLHVNHQILKSSNIMALLEYIDGSILAATSSQGLFRYFQDRWINLSENSELGYHFFTSLFLDSHGVLWIGTADNGLYKYENDSFQNYTKNSGLGGGSIHCIFEDHDHTLWVGTIEGLYSHDKGMFSPSPHDALSTSSIYYIHQDAQKRMYFATLDSGLIMLKSDKLTSFTTAEGLYTNAVYSILEDPAGNFWMACDKGIISVSKNDLLDYEKGLIHQIQCRIFNENDGLKTREAGGGTQPSSCKAQDGQFFFPTVKGMAVINPGCERKSSQFQNVLIKYIKTKNDILFSAKEFVFPPGKRNITFYLDIIDFSHYQDTKIRYRLNGYKEEWSELSGKTDMVAQYEGLKKGQYEFEMMLLNNQYQWIPAPTRMKIQIEPYFYQKKEFLILLILMQPFLILLILKIAAKRKERLKLKRYKSAKLEKNKADEYLDKIVSLIEKEKMYRDTHLTISKLAKRASIQNAYISQIINIKLNKTFYDFINSYRVEEAKQIIKEKSYLKIQAIGYDVGFNSKSSFYKAFNKFVGMTPAEYRDGSKDDTTEDSS